MLNEILQTQLRQGRLEDAGGFPRVVLIDTVSYCNLKCSMCVHKEMTRKKGIMSWPLFTKIIDEIADTDKDARVWMVFFGEALILKRGKHTIFDMIAYAKKRGLTDVVLNSNANLLDGEAARGLIDSGLDAVYVGLDAFKPETYSKIRVGGDYDKAVGNVKNLMQLKRQMRVNRPLVYVQFVEMDENVNEKEDFIDFWSSQGAIVKIRPKISWAGLIDAPNQALNNADRWPCHWAMQTISIADDGRVVLCPVDLDARFVAGDIKKQSIKEVWNGGLKALRKLHLAGRYQSLPPLCRDCKDWQSARSDYCAATECR